MPLFKRKLITPPEIDITVSHKLDVAEVRKRLSNLLQQGDGTGFIDPAKTTFTWNGPGSSFNFDTTIQSKWGNLPVKGVGTIAPSYFRLSSEPLPYWTSLGLWYISGLIKAKLEKLLA